MKSYLLFFLTLLSLFSHCTYNTHEEVFTEINISDSDLPYVILNFAENTIEIKEETELVFKLENDKSNEGFVEYTFTLDGRSYTKQGEGENIAYYYISPKNYVDGQVIKLSFEGIARSGTRSLADRLDAEYYIISGSWDIKINAEIPSKILPKVGIEQGRLIIAWDKVDLDYNYKYVLNIEKTGLEGKHYESKEFDKSDSLFYFDYDFNGIQRSYWVDLVSNWYGVQGDTVTFEVDPINIKHYALGHSHVVIKWDTIPLFNHDINYCLKYDVYRNEKLNLFADSVIAYYPDFLNDSTLVVNAKLGDNIYEQKQYQEDYYINNPSDIIFGKGHNFDHFNNLLYSDVLNKIILIRSEYDGMHLYQIDPNNRIIEVDNKLGYGGQYCLPPGSNSLSTSMILLFGSI
jgi:hypothetical protein